LPGATLSDGCVIFSRDISAEISYRKAIRNLMLRSRTSSSAISGTNTGFNSLTNLSCSNLRYGLACPIVTALMKA
jgi:hypothetical protein